MKYLAPLRGEKGQREGREREREGGKKGGKKGEVEGLELNFNV